MGRAKEDLAPNSGTEFNGGSYQNQPQTRSSLHPQHQQPESFPPNQESHHDYDVNQPAAFPAPLPGKAHAFPPPQADQQMPVSFAPRAPPQFDNQHMQGFHQQGGFNGGSMNAGMGNMVNTMHVGIPINNPTLQPMLMTMPTQMPTPMPMPMPAIQQTPMRIDGGVDGNNAFGPWKTSLFGCCDDKTNALMTFCCPCVTFGRNAEIVDRGQSSCFSLAFRYTWSLITFWTMVTCTMPPCLHSSAYRGKLRNRFGLVESPCPDFIIHCFCQSCALCQEHRELKQRGYDPSIGWAGNAAKMRNVNGGGVMMTPPPVQPMMMGR